MLVRAWALALLLPLAGCRTKKAQEPKPAADPCAELACGAGMHCDAHGELACDTPPCPRGVACVPDPDENPCNVKDCGPSTVCVVEHGRAECIAVPDEDDELDAGMDAG